MGTRQEQEIGLLNMMAASAFAAREAPPSTFSVLHDDGASVNTSLGTRTRRMLPCNERSSVSAFGQAVGVASPTGPWLGTPFWSCQRQLLTAAKALLSAQAPFHSTPARLSARMCSILAAWGSSTRVAGPAMIMKAAQSTGSRVTATGSRGTAC